MDEIFPPLEYDSLPCTIQFGGLPTIHLFMRGESYRVRCGEDNLRFDTEEDMRQWVLSLYEVWFDLEDERAAELLDLLVNDMRYLKFPFNPNTFEECEVLAELMLYTELASPAYSIVAERIWAQRYARKDISTFAHHIALRFGLMLPL